MLFGNKRLYEQTCRLKKGISHLPPCLEALRKIIVQRFGVQVLNVVYDRIDIGPRKGDPRLTIIVETETDHAKLHADRWTIKHDTKAAILEAFADVVAQAGAQPEYDTNDVLLLADDFSDEAMHRAAAEFLEHDEKAFRERFAAEGVWQITGFSKAIVVFFQSEKTKRAAITSGVVDRIRRDCYDCLKRYDEFDYFTPDNVTLHLDSKENLDKNFAGSLFYYFK